MARRLHVDRLALVVAAVLRRHRVGPRDAPVAHGPLGRAPVVDAVVVLILLGALLTERACRGVGLRPHAHLPPGGAGALGLELADVAVTELLREGGQLAYVVLASHAIGVAVRVGEAVLGLRQTAAVLVHAPGATGGADGDCRTDAELEGGGIEDVADGTLAHQHVAELANAPASAAVLVREAERVVRDLGLELAESQGGVPGTDPVRVDLEALVPLDVALALVLARLDALGARHLRELRELLAARVRRARRALEHGPLVDGAVPSGEGRSGDEQGGGQGDHDGGLHGSGPSTVWVALA